MNNLSDRLEYISEMVLPGKSVADIGTDHGYIPIHLLAENIIPFAVLSDVNEGPLSIAEKNIAEAGIRSELYSLRLGSGFETIGKGEVSSVVVAGMGGELIEAIIEEDLEKSKSFERLILQPRTHSNELRYYLSSKGFEIVDYRLVKERGRICEIISVIPCMSDAALDTELVSNFLLGKNDPLINEFIDYKLKTALSVKASLQNSKGPDSEELISVWTSIIDDLTEIKKVL